MAVPKELVDLLRCPCDTHSEIEYKERRSVILCQTCEAVFPVRDNIPVMLLDEARPPRGQAEITTGDGTVIREP
jgi:uncharacterized protein YbaR (Trm112 family)